MRFKQFKPRPITEAILQQLDELRMNPTTLQQFSASDEAKGIMAGFEAELVFSGLGGEGDSDDFDMEPDMDADERCHTIQQVMDFFENDEWGYGLYGRSAEKLQEELDEKYYEWHDERMYEQFRDEAEELIKKAIEEDDWDWDDETRKQLDLMDLSDDEIEEAMKQGTGAPKFDTSGDQEEYALSNPGYQRYLEAREQADGLLDDLVQDSISSQDKHYDYALDEFRDSWYIDDDSNLFSDIVLRLMSDVAEAFELIWPVMTGTGSSQDGGFSEENARMLAKSLSDELSVKTKVSGGYHSAKRDDVTWIFEPDSSLDADDSENMPVEIVSPPMPLLDCLRQMENFFTWAEDNGAYANSSTGFHMGVSLPHRGGNVDYVKLALFLGDEHVLREFGRSGNHFCEAAIKKIRQRVKGNKEAVGNAMELMKHNLIELAQKALEINNHGFGKYTSINPQGGNDNTNPAKERGAKYIEFRSAGGSNYFEDIDKLKNTLLRYAQAMTIAANPAAERREYYKKLYKLISPPEGDPAIDLFSRFASGEISSEQLKKSWADKALATDAPELMQKGNWVVIDQGDGRPVPGQEYNGYTKEEARSRAKQKLSPGSSDEGFDMGYEIMPKETGKWEVYSKDDAGNEKTLEIVDGERKGEAVDKVYDKYAEQNIPFFVRPWYQDTNLPQEPKLTPRAKLAKNIKAAPAEEIKNWKVYDTKTGEVHYEQEGRKSNLVQAMRKFEIDQKLPRGRLAIEEIPGKDDEGDTTLRTWEIVDRYDNNKVLDTVGGTEAEAERVRKSWVERAGNGEDHEIGKRTVPNDASKERYEDRGDWEFFYEPTGRVLDKVTDISQTQARGVLADVQRRYGDLAAPSIQMRKASAVQDTNINVAQNFDTPPAGFVTQRPATGDYYEVRSGDRAYGYLSVAAGQTPGGMGPARAARDYVNNLTGRSDAQLVYKAGDPVQAVDGTGEPIWQIYERETGHVVEEFSAPDQSTAWEEARGWLEDMNAEDPSLFSCRPKMES